MRNNPNIDELIIHHCPWAISDRKFSYREYLRYALKYPKLLQELREKRFDLAIDLRGDFRNILFFAFLSGAKYRLSYDQSGGEYLLTMRVPFERNKPEVDKKLNLLETLGIYKQPRKLELRASLENSRHIEKLFKEFNNNENSLNIILHPSAKQIQRWPVKNFAILADQLIRLYKANIIITGSDGDTPIAKEINTLMNFSPILLTGKTTIGQFTGLLEKVDLIVSADTGIMHMAVATNTPGIFLFGPTEPNRFGHVSEKHIIIQKKPPCTSNLYHPRCEKSQTQWSACMEAITVDDVMEAVRVLINNKPSRQLMTLEPQ